MLFPRKYQKIILISLCVVISLVMLSYSVKRSQDSGYLKKVVLEISSPFSEVFGKSLSYIGGVWQRYLFLIGLESENQRLKRENALLASQLLQYQEGYLEGQRLRKLLTMGEQLKLRFVAARVIDRDHRSLIKTLRIDRGSRQGVTVGMAVLADRGVVGRVVETSWNVARVLLIIDDNSNIDAMVQRARTEGILQGAGPLGCTLKYVANIEDVKLGDTVVTSGLSGVFPKGLLLGAVTHVSKKEGGLFQKIEVEPAVEIARVEEVLLLIRPEKK